MPIVQPSVLVRPEDAVEYLASLLSDSTLGLEYVAKYDEPLIPKYPAVLVMSGKMTKEFHGTHTWAITLRAEIYVMHAKLTENRATRNLEDLRLATQVVSYLERDLELGGRVIVSWVEDETPGAMPPRMAKAPTVISTRLMWIATNEARF